VWSAGAPVGSVIDLPGIVGELDQRGDCPAQVVAETILDAALRLDKGRPHDDATVLVVKILPQADEGGIRRLVARVPI
jgi:hypothetical protein